MSDGVQIVMRIDPIKPTACFQTASDVIAWLRSESVITPNRRDHYPGWTRWAPGERWADVVSDIDEAPFLHLLHNGVDVETERMFYGAGSESPECPSCGSSVERAHDFGDLVDQWLDEGEPSVTCSVCSAIAPLGEWRGEPWSYGYVGAPAVTFNNWFRLSDTFVHELSARLGGRCRRINYKS